MAKSDTDLLLDYINAIEEGSLVEAVHVMPNYGKKHVERVDCWCEPVDEDEDGSLWVHRDMN